jgi:hypothetical protein
MKEKKKHDEPSARSQETRKVSAKTGARKSLRRAALQNNDTEPDIRGLVERRAYEIWEERGGGDGGALDDWLRAETEVSGTVREIAESQAEPESISASGAGASR